MKELRRKRKYSIPGAMREDLIDKSGSLLDLESRRIWVQRGWKSTVEGGMA